MSRILRTVKWFREVSVLADDEQRRSGHPEIDVEHLFLALLGIGGPVTEALAARGIDLAGARAAAERLHAERRAGLGIAPSAAAARRRIPEQQPRGGFVYRDGIRPLLEEAANEPQPDIALLAEPSGHVADLLRALGVQPGGLEIDATASEAPSSVEQVGHRRDRALRYRRFLPASPAAVWALIADAERWLEWNDFEFERAEPTATGVIRAAARERGIDGRPTRVKPQHRISEFVVSRFEPPRLIQWERSFPDAGVAGAHSLRIELAAAGSGTEATLAFLHAGRPPGRRGLSATLLRPIARIVHPIAVRAHLRGKADNLSRALRR